MAIKTDILIAAICEHPDVGDHEILGDFKYSELRMKLEDLGRKKINRFARDLGIDLASLAPQPEPSRAVPSRAEVATTQTFTHRSLPPGPVVFQEPQPRWSAA